VRDLYLKSVDFASPSLKDSTRSAVKRMTKSKIDADLHGRIRGAVMSFKMMDNPKYKEIESLLEIMEDSHDKDSSFEKQKTPGAPLNYSRKKESSKKAQKHNRTSS
jgi:hypothetical protein